MNTPCLWVNNQGKRFMNESLLKDTVEYSSTVLAQGGYAYTIYHAPIDKAQFLADFEVLTEEHIAGLYATGNNVSGVSVAAYVNVEGVGLGFALTSGRLAGAMRHNSLQGDCHGAPFAVLWCRAGTQVCPQA